jgi:hypothetical protein
MAFYFFHEFWSEVLIFHTINVLAMFSTPFQNLFLGPDFGANWTRILMDVPLVGM